MLANDGLRGRYLVGDFWKRIFILKKHVDEETYCQVLK
jgi:hypothetical protein